MGVNDLWPVLSEICERKPLTYLAGKKVAIDLSGWVVQATTCKGLKGSRNPHLRNLFFRVSRLLQFGVYPIFVMEGKLPSLKETAFKERNFDRHPESTSTTGPFRQMFDRTLKECQDILTCLGVPCVRSSGEAEAFCAFLCLKGVVDGVITEDNDAFLYGADVVYRDFTIEAADSHVDMYCLKSKKNKLGLTRQKLVALALLLGCDYSKGVPGVGKETALKLLSEMHCDDILQRFKDWKSLDESELFPGLENKNIKKTSHCKRCEHLGTVSKHKKDGCLACDSQFTCYLPDATKPCKCPWHKNNELMTKWKTELKIYNAVKNCPDFPNLEVIEEYLNYTDKIPSDELLEWNCPNLINFQEEALNYLGWTFESSCEKIIPLITSWQQFRIQTNSVDKSTFLFEPVKVVRERHLRDVAYFDVEWKSIDENYDIAADNLNILEYGDRFSVCYKETVEEFFRLKSELNEVKKLKKVKKLKSDEKSQKVKSESPLYNLDILSCDKICSPKNSSIDDSFNGLLDIPLWERVKALPKALFQKYSTPVPKTAAKDIHETSVFFNKISGTCNIFSPLVPDYSDSRLQIKYKENIRKKLAVSINEEMSNLCSENVTNHLTSDPRPSICLDFSNDSFLDKLLSQKDVYKCFENSCQQSVLLDEVLKNTDPTPVQSTVNFVNEIHSENMEYEENFSSLFSEISDVSPCLLYSLNPSPKVVQDKVCIAPLFSEIFDNSTPAVNDEILSKNSLCTPLSSKITSKLIFSPLIFDSSIDVSVS